MLLRVAAAVLFALAALASFGLLLGQNTEHAVGFIAGGLLAYVLSTIPVGPVA